MGVIVSERVLPVPVITISVSSTTFVFDEVAVTINVLSPGKLSVIVKTNPEAEPLIHSNWFAKVEPEGVSFEVVVKETSSP